MTQATRLGSFIGLVILTALVLGVFFLLPDRVAEQDPTRSESEDTRAPDGRVLGPWPRLKTSLKGGVLQQRLEAAFPDSFRERVFILWGPTQGWISPEVFDWWVSRVEPEGLTSEAAQRMFSGLPGRRPVFANPNERQICAVVGASRNLLGSHYGTLIDAHDVVFRVNRAPTAEFDRDVGSRTTHHVMWPTALGANQADRRAVLLMNPVSLHIEFVFDEILSLVNRGLPWEASRARIIHPEFIKYIHEDWMDGCGQFPSTGFIALMTAVHVCDEVNVFGFGADAEGRWDRYYEHHLEKPSYLHPVDVETRLRREMEEKGILRVFLGNRSSDGVEFPGFEIEESEED